MRSSTVRIAVLRDGDATWEVGVQYQPVGWYYLVRRPLGSDPWQLWSEYPTCYPTRYDAYRALARRYPDPSRYTHVPARAVAQSVNGEALR